MRHLGHWHCGVWAPIVMCLGCDTVAELTFQQEQLLEIVAQGFVDAQCIEDSSIDAGFRFGVLTSFDDRMTPGRRYSVLGDVLTPGENFTAEDISFSDGVFFVVDSAGADMRCESASECPEGASCILPSEMGLDGYYYAPERVCAYPSRVDVVYGPKFVHYRDDVQAGNALVSSEGADGRSFAFLLDNSASLDGSVATGVPDVQWATDPYQYRKVGLNQFMDGLTLTHETSPRLEYSALFANGIGESGVYDASEAWMRTQAVWENTVMTKYPSPSGGSPIWEAAMAVLKKIQGSSNAGYKKQIVALTDGAPNDDTADVYAQFLRQLAAVASSHIDLNWIDFEPGDRKPHTDYARAVAATCGTYHLLHEAAQIPSVMRALAINTESRWEVGVKFSASLPADHVYRLATTVVVRVGTGAVSYEAQRVSEQNEAIDNRLVLVR